MNESNGVAVALRRFGLCGGSADLARLRSDARGALLAELRGSALTPEQFADLPSMQQATELYQIKQKEARARAAAARDRLAKGPEAVEMERVRAGATKSSVPSNGAIQKSELSGLIRLAITTDQPLVERLSLFWSNHFTVSATRAQIAAMTGPFEREAIRPHMLGRFEDLVIASTFHPVMLRYLDNTASIGPDSHLGQRRKSAAVNENLARELLELHTLGVDGGYTQADVVAVAKALSGWTAGVWTPDATDNHPPHVTAFDLKRHQPGPVTVLGITYADLGPEQAPAIVRALARHPQTSAFVSTCLARHFLGDAAPKAVIGRMIETWTATDGDLRAVMEVLLNAPESWSLPAQKLRSPIEFMLSASRVIGSPPPTPNPLGELKAMGQPLFAANSPKGWTEADDGWVTPDGVKTRVDWSINVAARSPADLRPLELAEQAFAGGLTDETRTAIGRAESVRQGLTLLMMSPEMQRR